MGPFPPFNELATYQIFADLIISLTILLTFIYQEVRRKSLSQKLFWICALTTPLIGSFAPLLYLIWEKRIFQAD